MSDKMDTSGADCGHVRNVSATERLRRMLDERGVEWMDDSYTQLWCTVWNGHDGKQWRMTENYSGMLTELKVWHVTPEQAIYVTLGESHPYEQRITGDGSNWGEVMTEAFDSLMASASESCTPDEMRALESHIAATIGDEPKSMRVFDSMETALTIAEKEVEIEKLKRENAELCDENAELTHRRAELEAATLGVGKLTAEQVRDAVKRGATFDYGEIGEYVSRENWKAIADELNAALGGGECEAIHDKSYWKGIHGYCEGLKCSNCGEPLFSEFKSCPWCGMTIRKAVKR